MYPLICCDAASVIGRDGVVMGGRRIIKIYFLYALWIIGACRSRRCRLPLCWPGHPAHVGHEAPQRPQQAPRTAMAAVAGGDGLCHAAMSRRPRPGRGKSESATTPQRIVNGRIPSELPTPGALDPCSAAIGHLWLARHYEYGNL